jgi:hypothetical protein
VAQGAAPPVDCQVIPVEEYDDNEPLLVDEEVQEVQEEHEQDELLPYQLTSYYQQQTYILKNNLISGLETTK